jgi:hypothetical protein
MPVNNDVYGVWKLLQWTDDVLLGTAPQYYVVERADIGTEQEIKNSPFVQGTGLPLILNVSGATARLRINAPLLVTEEARQEDRANDKVSDGYRLWRDLIGGGGTAAAGDILKSNYVRETGIVFEQLGFSVDANQGCRYTINVVGDSNYLREETGLSTGSGIEIKDGTTISGSPETGVYQSSPVNGYYGPFRGTIDPITGHVVITPCRLATFYDVVGTVSTGNETIEGYLEKLNITYSFQTQGFNYVGQPTQRRILGMGAIEARVEGTMISGVRQPLGYQFPWQAMNVDNDVEAGTLIKTEDPQRYGGTVKHSEIAFTVRLRDGVSNTTTALSVNLVPGLSISRSLFQSSTQQVSSDLLRTNFNAFGWVTDPVPFG